MTQNSVVAPTLSMGILTTTVATAGLNSPGPSATSSSGVGGSGESDGSPLDVSNMAAKKEARSLLGLTVGIVAGVAWF